MRGESPTGVQILLPPLMKREFSAGGIVFKKNKNKVVWLVVQHSQHKGWVFPKGLIGDSKENESKEDTAVREVKEEGGIQAKLIKELPEPTKYWYVFKGEKILKTVYFYLMKYLSGNIKDHDFEVSDSKWLSAQEVRKILTFKNDKKAFEVALKLFQNLKLSYNNVPVA